MRESKQSHKFMQVLDLSVYNSLQNFADSKGITVQELIRAIIIPDWVNAERERIMLRRRIQRATVQIAKRSRRK